MKTLFFLLLAANLALGAWLLLGEPLDMMREPGRMAMQINPDRVHLLTDDDVARKRSQAERAAASTAAAAAVQPRPEAPAQGLPQDLPLASCVEIGTFGSENGTKKLRARLSAAGISDHVTLNTVDKTTVVHITGIDADSEAKIHEVLKDFPKVQLAHCAEGTAGK